MHVPSAGDISQIPRNSLYSTVASVSTISLTRPQMMNNNVSSCVPSVPRSLWLGRARKTLRFTDTFVIQNVIGVHTAEYNSSIGHDFAASTTPYLHDSKNCAIYTYLILPGLYLSNYLNANIPGSSRNACIYYRQLLVPPYACLNEMTSTLRQHMRLCDAWHVGT